jgi:hypothetical protein
MFGLFDIAYRGFAIWAAGGVGCILAATFFWNFSQNPGQFLCNPTSSFQPHRLLWHPLAGGMAVFLYFYWRLDTDDSSTVDLSS